MPLFPLKPISISLSPNVQRDDVLLSWKLLIKQFLNIKTSLSFDSQVLENKCKEYMGAKHAFSFNSGRSALYTIIKALNMSNGDEVLLQAFTCNAVPNPVLWTGGTPVYADIDESLNIDPRDLEKKITPRSRAVIIQHTFGAPASIDEILEVARRHNLVVIEDCAHSLGAEYKGGRVGTFGDVAFFSFGRDKVISSVWGGVVTTNDENLARRIGEERINMRPPSRFWAIKQIAHPILFSVIIPTHYIFGKYLLAFLRIVRGVGLAVSQKERMGERPNMFPALMPDALAELAIHQFEKLSGYNAHRKQLAEIYFRELGPSVVELPVRKEGCIYLRFNVRHPKAKEIIREAKHRKILLGDWYKNVIDPRGTDFEKMKYTLGSCPNAERIARESINLPTHINISKRNAKRIIQYLRDY